MKLRNTLFILVTLGLLLIISIYITIKPANEKSLEENRYLTSFNNLKDTSFFDGSLQKTIEDAYADQFPKRNLIVNFKKTMDEKSNSLLIYNQSEYILNKMNVNDEGEILRLGNSDRMINSIIEDTLENETRVKTRAIEMNDLAKRHKNVKFYVYKPTQIHETSIFDKANNIVAGAPALEKILEENLEIPFKSYKLNSLNQYKEMFFASDHHPTNIGSDIFYNEIMNFIKPNEKTLKPIEEDCHVKNTFYGTFANRTGRITKPDNFCVYYYDIVDYDVNSKYKTKEYKKRIDFKNYDYKTAEDVYYYNVAYQIYNPIMELDTHRENLENILVIGDSFSNSIIDLIASHYNKTYRVAPYDVMILENKLFDYDTFIKENNIDTVLFMFTMENYYYKDIWGDRYEQNSIIENGGR